MVTISRRTIYYAVALVALVGIVLIVVFTTRKSSPTISGPPVYVETKSGGIIEGVILSREKGTVSGFYGIPFAQPPVNELRFQKAVMHPGFKSGDTFKANTLPPGCIQYNAWKPVPDSEDCLFLNVFVPGDKIDSTVKKPVMVWIYGGSFLMGSIRLDNSELASFGDVIVVTIAYRVGIYGWLKSSGKVIDTNIGLRDQSLALQWVHENIASFGGDASQVTIFGESAGSISVGFHFMSKYSRPYFQRAILESGAPSPVGIDGGIDPLSALDLAKETNCPVEESPSMLKCLQNLSVDVLREAQTNLMSIRHSNAIIPNTDRDVIPSHPFHFFKQENAFADHHKEVIIGINGDEGAMFIQPMFPDLFPLNKSVNANLTWVVMKKHLEAVFKDKPDVLEKFMSLMNPNDNDSSAVITEKFSQMISQLIFGCASFRLATNFTRHPERKVYFYQFDVRPQISTNYPWAKKAVHTDEIPFVFGHPFLSKDLYNEKERSLSKTIMTYWSNFAKTGVPSDTWKACQGKDLHHLWIKDHEGDFEMKPGLPDNICDPLMDLFPVPLD